MPLTKLLKSSNQQLEIQNGIIKKKTTIIYRNPILYMKQNKRK